MDHNGFPWFQSLDVVWANGRDTCSISVQVDSVDIKRLPDGSSRGFAFVKFSDKEGVGLKANAAGCLMIMD